MLDATALATHRPALVGHCYRMLGSPVDADDAVQETLIRAWRAAERFDGRSSERTWLTRIATNVCLDQLSDRARRVRVIEDGPRGTPASALETHPRTHWLEPIHDAAALPTDATPAEQVVLRQSLRLAFVAALQHLPPKQRAALLLADVLGWSAAEIGETLDTTVASINSALQRARATLAERDATAVSPAELTAAQRETVDRYLAAFEAYDLDALVSLLAADATLCMPPYSLWIQGPAHIRDWLVGPGAPCRGSKLLPLSANGAPAFAQYRDGGATPWALVVLDLHGDRIGGITSFLDTEGLFPKFGVPAQIGR